MHFSLPPPPLHTVFEHHIVQGISHVVVRCAELNITTIIVMLAVPFLCKLYCEKDVSVCVFSARNYSTGIADISYYSALKCI